MKLVPSMSLSYTFNEGAYIAVVAHVHGTVTPLW